MHSSEDKENVPPSRKGKRQEREKFTAAIADQEYDATPAESREVDYRSKGWLFDLLERGNKEATDIVAWRLEGTVHLTQFYRICLFIQFLVCR
jgi:hypothetical protein